MNEIIPAKSVAAGVSVQKMHGGETAQKITPSSPIGMFDSGVGGLTVLKEVMKQLPDEEVIYFGDTARVPYGSRTPNEIVRFNYEILNFFVSMGVKAVVMACGTSSAIAYPIVKEHYKFPIISLIEPGSAAAVNATKNGKIGVIATQATTDSSAYPRAIKRISKEIKVTSAACPLFVPLIEGGFIEADETKRVASQYLKPLQKAGVDTLILGCTHYPHLIKILREIAGMTMKFVDPAEEAVAETKKLLISHGLLSLKKASQTKEKYHYYVSGSPIQFQDLGSQLLGRIIPSAKKITIAKFGVKPPVK